ncbi:hypothetical protein SAMN04489724_4439 [Algoriphagus locisalis]|uniref:Uncharacterized protein n=1 Tax=Algoriphagus locisalis TaxID=305507 RepID=A0A1I7DVA6_9BACT|nr:hypothetical protein SAMN04489724_4439 [Algoriphagus locisalis]
MDKNYDLEERLVRFAGEVIKFCNMDIRNDASNQYFFAHLVRRPMTEDRSGLNSKV